MKRQVGRRASDLRRWTSVLGQTTLVFLVEVRRLRSEARGAQFLVKPEAHLHVDLDSYGLAVEPGRLEAPGAYGSDGLLVQAHT